MALGVPMDSGRNRRKRELFLVKVVMYADDTSWCQREGLVDYRAARRRILEVLNCPDVVTIYKGHAKHRMLERGVTAGEVQRVLRGGAVVEGPTWNAGCGNWQCDVEGYNSMGMTLRVGVAFFEQSPNLIIITVIVR